MFDPLKNGFVNWTDGMKISQSHFHQLQHAIANRVKDSRATTIRDDNFGLIPSGYDEEALEYDVRIEERQNLKIKISKCRGISPAGDRFEIITGTPHSSYKSFERTVHLSDNLINGGGRFFLVLRANHGEVHAYGDPDPEESPARLPFIDQAYEVEIASARDSKNVFKNSLVIGMFGIENREVILNPDYIPPSAAMSSHKDLREFAFKYAQFLGDLDTDLFKINKNVSDKSQLTPLAQSVTDFAHNLILTIQIEIDLMRMFAAHLPPSLFLLNAKKMARSIKNSIELNSNEKKEELLNYIQEVININPGEYLTINQKVLDLEYDHYHIQEMLRTILEFCKTNSKLIGEWSNLDYIGKKKTTGIFVGEVKKETEGIKERKKWDF